MPLSLELETPPTEISPWRDIVFRVCRRIPPLWDLSNYVAVNPFLGFSTVDWQATAAELLHTLDADLLPPGEYYQSAWNSGTLNHAHLAAAAEQHGYDAEYLADLLAGTNAIPVRPYAGTSTLAERHDRACGSHWNQSVHASICRWCAIWATGGGAAWTLSPTQGLYASWRAAAQVDQSLEIAGLRGWRRWIKDLPACPNAAIDAMLTRVSAHVDDKEAYLYRLLGGVYGWASFLRRDTWSSAEDAAGMLGELLAVRLCADVAVHELAPASAKQVHARSLPVIQDQRIRAAFQDALEDGYVSSLLRKLKVHERPVHRPEVQAAFCIDVRSELLRRNLEAQSETIETIGFAGFFGIFLDWRTGDTHSARCPVLLKPSFPVCGQDVSREGAFAKAAKGLQGAPSAAFSFVELLGLSYGIHLAKDALARQPATLNADAVVQFVMAPAGVENGVGLQARADIAASILRNMGLRERFARLILLCGHEGHSANNPHAASLDCGACGGHSGAINARVAAALLNDPAVRDGLWQRGLGVPSDTRFLAGVHDTATDEVHLLDVDLLPLSHKQDLVRLRGWLESAGVGTRQERAHPLGFEGLADEPLRKQLLRRSRDWSETRPEWGLAKNAAFIAARRQRSRGVNLEGRAFLHDYDWRNDTDNAILGLILSAPMVVASWINLQYFASTVDNDRFGAGNKTLHNRVDTLGVVIGNGGDLRTGLPLQSVQAADGRWYHEPLRLQVVVEAPLEKISEVLNTCDGARDLVENGWVRLFALDPDSNTFHRWVPGRGWVLFQAEEGLGMTPAEGQ